jgi:hypothetical protein
MAFTARRERWVRAGSAWHREPLVLGGHERSPSGHENRRSHGIHGPDLSWRSSLKPGSNPSVPLRLREPTAAFQRIILGGALAARLAEDALGPEAVHSAKEGVLAHDPAHEHCQACRGCLAVRG